MSAGRRKQPTLQAVDAPSSFRRQHGGIARHKRAKGDGTAPSYVNEAESPLAWLARRKGSDGRPFISPVQLAAGERLRADFTRAGLTPRVTANWNSPIAQGRRGASNESAAGFSDMVIAAKERLTRTLEAVGPEFAGLLLDVCCFLKGLEMIERERRWPPRAVRIVLSLALERLARHYGIELEAKGPARSRSRAWQADGARPTFDGT
jgi:hypothetical protein